MPYKGDVNLKFPTDESRNTLIVFGDNMRGKTSLLNAIRWGFYGKALGRHLREIPLHLMPNSEATSQNDWHMEVRILFEADGNQYDLRRIADKKTLVARPDKPEDLTVDTFLQKNGAAIPGNEIESEINKFAPEQVSRFFLFDGELLQEYEELLVEGSDQGKKIKESIEQVLGVPALINGRNDVYMLLKRAQKIQEQDAAKIKGMEGIAEKQRDWIAKRESYEKDLYDLNKKLEETNKERIDLEDYLEKFDSIIKQKTEYDLLADRKKQLEAQMNETKNERLSLVSDAWRDLLAPKLSKKRSELESIQSNLLTNMSSKVEIETLLDLKKAMLANSVCPTCNQTMHQTKIDAIEADIANLTKKIESLNSSSDDLASISMKINSISKITVGEVYSRIVDADRLLAKSEHELSKTDNRLDDINSEIRKFDTDEMMRTRKRRDFLYGEGSKLTSDIRIVESNIAEADKELKILSQRISENKSRSYTRSSIMAMLAESLNECFSKSIEELRMSLREKVQDCATQAFKQLTSQQSYQGLKINENYGLQILDHNGADVPVRSAGAEQIVALSLIDGLSKAGRSAGPVVMDTPFGRLDTKHRKNILGYLPKAATQLILFVHDGEIRGSEDLNVIAHKIGGQYIIREISSTHSTIETK